MINKKIWIKCNGKHWDEVVAIFLKSKWNICSEFIDPSTNDMDLGFVAIEYFENNSNYDEAEKVLTELHNKYWAIDGPNNKERFSVATGSSKIKDDPWYELGWRP
jgi:hypothetical protein